MGFADVVRQARKTKAYTYHLLWCLFFQFQSFVN